MNVFLVRMNEEVSKSHKKMKKLADEFGAETIAAWQSEHASEVLQPHQIELLNHGIAEHPWVPSIEY